MYYRRLRDLREDHDLKQKEIAQLLDIDQRVYSNYETGKQTLPVRYLLQLADYYGTSTDYILVGAQTTPSLMKNGENR